MEQNEQRREGISDRELREEIAKQEERIIDDRERREDDLGRLKDDERRIEDDRRVLTELKAEAERRHHVVPPVPVPCPLRPVAPPRAFGKWY